MSDERDWESEIDTLAEISEKHLIRAIKAENRVKELESMMLVGGSAGEAMARVKKAEARVDALEALCGEVGELDLSDPRRWLVLRERLRAAGRGEELKP